MTRFPIGILTILAATLAAPLAAQEAFIGQVGSSNMAMNLGAGARNLQVIEQIGNDNSGAQIGIGDRNTMALVQANGDGNTAASVVSGNRNLVGTAQLGSSNLATTGIFGNRNSVGTVQIGRNHVANLTVLGNDNNVDVTQRGSGRVTNLTVEDGFDRSRRNDGTTAYAELDAANNRQSGLNVSVFQNRNDPAINAYVGRDRRGNIVVRPGSATTILQLGS